MASKWTPWYKDPRTNTLYKKTESSGMNGEWNHHMFSAIDEPDPDKNHIHYKWRFIIRNGLVDGSETVLCSVKTGNWSSINRGRLIKRLKEASGGEISLNI